MRCGVLLGLTLLALTAVVPLVGCQDYLFCRYYSEKIVEQDRTITATVPTPADILFVVDNSGSMAEEQDNLANNFQLFINELTRLGGDYQIAVITTDQINRDERAGRVRFEFAPEPYYEQTTFDTSMCVDVDIARGCFRGDDPTARIIGTERLSPDEQVSLFQDNVLVGTCGTGQEQGLKAMVDALSKTGAGECNAGFLRRNANLVVVIVSDENDDDDTPIAEYIDQLAAIKGSTDAIRVATIVGAVDGEASDCKTGDGGAADGTCGTLVCGNEPDRGRQVACLGRGQGTCESGEVCFELDNGRECRDAIWGLWSQEECRSCSVFNAPDCCLADAGTRYVQFARAVEERIVADPAARTGCSPTAENSVCLIGSICEQSFGQLLVRIARELVFSNEFALNPPAEYPPGVRARLIVGDAINELVPGVDFSVTSSNGVGIKLTILDNDLVPDEDNESLQVYYISEIESDENRLEGSCTSTTPSG